MSKIQFIVTSKAIESGKRTGVTAQKVFADTEDVKALRALLNRGEAAIYTTRADGTVRRMAYLKAGTPERKLAQKAFVLKKEGASMKEVGEELHLSVPSVRRLLVGLQVAKALEKGQLPTETQE